jgi:hypothetical protein
MIKNQITQVIQAIKNFDIVLLHELLDDDIPYMDVTKALFLKKLNKQFKFAKKNDCHFFDDVFFGICGSCNKGCEGMTFLSESGYYLDLYIESKDEKTIADINVCNNLTNFTNLIKTNNLSFGFKKDQGFAFKPSIEYTLSKQEYNLLRSHLNNIKGIIKLDDLFNLYNNFYYLITTIDQLEPLAHLDYKAYSKAVTLTVQINRILKIKTSATHAIDALINYQLAKSEREQLIWFYENISDHSSMYSFEFPKNWKLESCIRFKSGLIKLNIDISGYEYVIDYFIKLDDLYDDLMEKYKPLPKHFEQSGVGGIEFSLENLLKIHNKHLDVVKMYSKDNDL